ncbi:MAG: hypothetical protein HW392_515 [Steroidobacteraceae bacterium]|nr:hypothetical protein [Steroidobacteraceae bacterium]
MTPAELEAAYIDRIKQVGCLLLLTAEDAICLVGDCANANIRFLGVEAYRIHDNDVVQPALEYSNIRFGRTEKHGDTIKLTEFKRALRSEWTDDVDVFKHTEELIRAGAADGYSWYEVSLEDPTDDSLLFFRSIGA